MRIIFLGCGEACDPCHPNTSVLVESDDFEILLDCGFTVPHRYFSEKKASESLNAVWLSHFHGDHYFGLPLLLLELAEKGRRSPLYICGQKGTGKEVAELAKMAYGSMMDECCFDIRFVEIEPGKEHEVAGALWRTAETDHSRRNLALRLTIDDKTLFYSGDGGSTPDTYTLAKGCQVIIHESYRVHGETPGHGSVDKSIKLAEKAGAKVLALVHLKEDQRGEYGKLIRDIRKGRGLDIIMPESGSAIEF